MPYLLAWPVYWSVMSAHVQLPKPRSICYKSQLPKPTSLGASQKHTDLPQPSRCVSDLKRQSPNHYYLLYQYILSMFFLYVRNIFTTCNHVHTYVTQPTQYLSLEQRHVVPAFLPDHSLRIRGVIYSTALSLHPFFLPPPFFRLARGSSVHRLGVDYYPPCLAFPAEFP